MSGERKIEKVQFLQQVLNMVEWLKEGTGSEEGSGGMEKELSVALGQLGDGEEERRRLEENVRRLEQEVEELRGELEREKWERCHAEGNLREMGREMGRVFGRIEEVVRLAGGEVEEEDEEESEREVEVVDVKKVEGVWGNGFERVWRSLGELKMRIKDKWQKREEFEEETRKELAKARGFVEDIQKLMKQREEEEEEQQKKMVEVEVKASVLPSPPRKEEETRTSPPSTPSSTPAPATVITEEPETNQVTKEEPEVEPLNLMKVDTRTCENTEQMDCSPPTTATTTLALLTPPPQHSTEEPSTLTLTFHRQTTPPPTSRITPKQPSPVKEKESYPPQQIEFFRSLLGLPAVTPSPQKIQPESPSKYLQAPHIVQVNSPSPVQHSVIHFAVGGQGVSPTHTTPTPPTSPKTYINLVPHHMPPRGITEHGVDPSRRHLGYFCLCGLECSTKKTLQYHLQYLQQTGNGFVSGPTNNMGVHTTSMHQRQSIAHLTPQSSPNSQHNHLRQMLSTKIRSAPAAKAPNPRKCHKCGKYYPGGKEGLRRHILQDHAPKSHQAPQSTGNHNQHYQPQISQDKLLAYHLQQNSQPIFPRDHHQTQQQAYHPHSQAYQQHVNNNSAYHNTYQPQHVPQQNANGARTGSETLHQPLPCHQCPELFRTMVQLKIHEKLKHSASPPAGAGEANWKSVDQLIS